MPRLRFGLCCRCPFCICEQQASRLFAIGLVEFLIAPPDLERIKSLAAQLVDAKSLTKIKKKEPLQRYIELYMVKCLEPKKKTR